MSSHTTDTWNNGVEACARMLETAAQHHMTDAGNAPLEERERHKLVSAALRRYAGLCRSMVVPVAPDWPEEVGR